MGDEEVKFKDILTKDLMSEGEDSLATVMKSQQLVMVKLLEILVKSQDEKFKTYVDSFKEHLNNIYPDAHYVNEAKKIDNEHIRDMLRINMEMDNTKNQAVLNKANTVQDFMIHRYKHHIDVLTGVFGIVTRTKKMMAWMMAKADAKEFELSLNGGSTPLLPG